MRSVLVWLMVCFGSILTATPARGDEPTCRPAELFVADDEPPLFELQADVTIALTGAVVTGSTPVDGVFWSEGLWRITDESAREFHLCVIDEPTLHTVAEALRHQLNEEAVLTFDYLPEANAVMITVPDIDIAHFREAFVADSAAHQRLRGGSVTTDHTLILIADSGDLGIARRLVEEAGGRWTAATIAYGKREFVNSV
ncbi:hypothetical protein [Mycobacterium riyadhense]|uniref:Uncharacterized protein n=1 Tax=Mycobacterium riyadhense TaxID=486698 RepID=A0A1X2CIK7_9MYCO|nr:hypothetical protein [Mycobacterium riyadhense]ORW75652.1 hypothetical protein AWC22_22610 [Mycobacterium riyadhense]VTO95148.1 hypothetical protein BIN_B_00626 [Mycobacterium riyadhense]